MRRPTDAESHSAPAVGRPVPWIVVAVDALDDYRLVVRFIDGTQGEVCLSKLVLGQRAGVFARLRDPALFRLVGITHGAVTWPGDLDLAPDAMYDEIRATGAWTPS